jgi:hypothetical protein
MDSRRSELALLVALLALGVIIYALRWFIFPGTAFHSEMWRFLLGDVAFLFLQVAVVTLIIDRLLRNRERQATLRKLNMVIGAFFSEVGTSLLGRLAITDVNLDQVRGDLVPHEDWTATDYSTAERALADHPCKIDIDACDLYELKARLVADKQFLLGLLGNQALLEHERFTELLWAVTHLTEELEARATFEDLPVPDRIHLAGDVKRAYKLLTLQWLDYMRHLQTQYPYLFSLASRTNPLDPKASPVVAA